VGHITLDNASNNDTMMKVLETMLAARDVSFDAHDRWIMCFAHIINLCSGQVIDAASGMAGNKNTNSLSGDDTIPSSPYHKLGQQSRLFKDQVNVNMPSIVISKMATKKGGSWISHLRLSKSNPCSSCEMSAQGGIPFITC